MEQIAQQLDDVRHEMVRLLSEYADATEEHRSYIYERCESLGGEIQELVGLLKMAVRDANHSAQEYEESDPEYVADIDQMSGESLTAIHEAGEEVAAAIRLLREARGVSDLADGV